MSAPTLGISTPWDFSRLDPDSQRARLAMMADSGIDAIITADHVSFHGGNGMDGLVRLAAMGGMEPRLRLHLGVFLLALRHPMVAARQITTLCETLPGRLTVGVGVGGEDRHEIEVCEIDPKTRGRRTDVALSLVRRLLDGETVDGDGEFYRFEAGQIRPTPTPRVPFVVGGRSGAALDRAGRLGDGWLAAWCSARRFAQGVAQVEEVGRECGRRLDQEGGWQHGLQLWVGVGRNQDEATGFVSRRMSEFYRLDFDLFARYTPVGTPEQIAEFLAPYVEAGAHTLNLAPCGPSPEAEVESMAEVKRLLVS